MYKIEARHTCTIIHNYMPGECRQLEHFFSIWDKLYFRYNPKAIKYDRGTRCLYIPRGYSVRKLEGMFRQNAYINPNCDPYDEGIDIKLKYLPRDKVQKESIAFIIGQGKYSYTRAKSQLAINLNTGAGKTYVTVVSAAIMQLRTIMITSSLGWINQWKERIAEYTDTQPNEIYTLTGSGSIAKILNGMEKVDKYKYILASHQTIKSYGDKYGWDNVGVLFKKLRVGLKIYDEAHLDFDNICDIDFATNTMKTLYLTATPARSDKDENKIYQASFETVPSIDLFDDERDPRTHYRAISYTSHPTPVDVENCKNAYGFNRLAYCDYIIKKDNYYKMLRILIEMSLDIGKTLIYIGTNKAITASYEWILTNFPELQNDVGIYTTLIKDKATKEEQLNKKIILSTTKSCGAAIDIKDLKMTIVLAEPFRSAVLARQTLGRTRDYGTHYIEIVDRGFYALPAYHKSKLSIFQKYALDTAYDIWSEKKLEEMFQEALSLQYQRYQLIAKDKELESVIDVGGVPV